ncbi:hypothetical protein E6O75_ATG06501 [Venturia nashicola]|uniref:Uncharacterized protein n=1 Tax=Venturia nashicola TaxID=86259 RepID=A0A4Z1P379_9PEZI|nr:hypothetical protein E6O75_ATG06501 [Venturia nashicola]
MAALSALRKSSFGTNAASSSHRSKGMDDDRLAPIVLIEASLHEDLMLMPPGLSEETRGKIEAKCSPEFRVSQYRIIGNPATIIAITTRAAAVARHSYSSIDSRWTPHKKWSWKQKLASIPSSSSVG